MNQYLCNIHTLEPVYYGHTGTIHECPDYQGDLIFQVNSYDKAPFVSMWIMQVCLFSDVLIIKFHCKSCYTICEWDLVSHISLPPRKTATTLIKGTVVLLLS